MNCAKCNAELKDNAKFCDSCGAPQGAAPSALQRNLLGYQLLGFFFGTLGCHSLYAGYIGKGLAQLLLCWTGISTVWGLVDIITVKVDAAGVPMVNPFYNSPEIKAIADARRSALFWLLAMICLCLFGIAGMIFGLRALTVVGQVVAIALLVISFISGAIAVFKGQILGLIGILLATPALLFIFWSFC